MSDLSVLCGSITTQTAIIIIQDAPVDAKRVTFFHTVDFTSLRTPWNFAWARGESVKYLIATQTHGNSGGSLEECFSRVPYVKATQHAMFKRNWNQQYFVTLLSSLSLAQVSATVLERLLCSLFVNLCSASTSAFWVPSSAFATGSPPILCSNWPVATGGQTMQVFCLYYYNNYYEQQVCILSY